MNPDERRDPARVDLEGEASRVEWIDFVRGAAIVALLVWHASAIPQLYEGVPSPQAVGWINEFLAPYRMPVLMFLSGILLPRSLRKPLGEFYWGKVRNLAWPYAVWAVILLASTGQLEKLFDPLAWIPVSYIWFLLFVFLYFCAAPVLSKVPSGVVPVVAIVVSLAIADRGFISKFVLFAAYFYLGSQVQSSVQLRELLSNRIMRWGMLIVTVTVNQLPSSRLLAIAVTLTGIAAVVGWASEFYGHSSRLPAIEWVGQRSIVFYLTHYPLMVGVSAAIVGFGAGAPLFVFLVNLVAALTVGSVVARFSSNLPLSLLFGLPRTVSPLRGA